MTSLLEVAVSSACCPPSSFHGMLGPNAYPRSKTDPLVGCGRHFGRTIRAFCHILPLIKNGMTRTMQLELERITEADLSPR